MPHLTGRVIAGRYNLQTPIGRGAMGVVWRARDQLLDRDVAVKEVVISALIGEDERRNAYQRTLREARTAARLSHRGVVAVYDVVEEDGRPWIIMELVPSQSLDQVLVVEGRITPARAGRVGQQLLSALAAAHAAGVLHRDVKPSNVLIAANRTGEGWEERAVLTDFGIAQFEGDPRLTQTGMVMGSPGFTAPERIRGGVATPASDLWSLGATIYAAVEGRGPYENRGGAITTMSAIINEDAPLAPHAGPLALIIAALLRRDPSTRPSASAAARMFARALPQLPEESPEPPAIPHVPTIRSAYVPGPSAPVASASATAADGTQPDEKPAVAAAEQPAETSVAQELAREAEELPSAGEAGEAAEPGSAAPPAETDTESDVPAESGMAAESEPAAAAHAGAESGAEDGAEDEPEPEPGPEAKAAKPPASENLVLEALPADTPAAGPKAADATLLASGPDDKESRAAQTAASRKGTAGYHPTQAAAPVARVTPSAPAKPPSTAPAKPAPAAEPAVAEPATPKPTFTAAKPADRAAPTFSAANPGRPMPSARPVPPSSAPKRPGYGQGSAMRDYPPSSQEGTTPFLSGARYRPDRPQDRPQGGRQYAGPSQPSPDLGRQYPPGAGGGYTGRRGQDRGRHVLWPLAAVIVAAAVIVGTVLALHRGGGSGNAASAGNTSGAGGQPTVVPSVEDTPTGFRSIDALNSPSAALPAADWTTQTVTRADARSVAAGFSIDVPPGWTETRKNLATDFTGPGNLLLEVDLTPQSTPDMLTAAGQVEATSKGRFPRYKRVNLRAEPVRHAEGAVWKFHWTPAGGVQQTVDDIFFAQSTQAGVQDYAIYIRSPSSTFGSTALPIFDMMLRTFQTVPAS